MKRMAGIQMTHVPYRCVISALADVMGGQVDIIFGSISATSLQAKAGKVRALSITSPKWLMVVPDVPTFNQAGLPGYDVAGRIVAARSPLRFGDAPLMPLVPSAELGAHNREVYCDWLGLSQDEVERLQKDEVI